MARGPFTFRLERVREMRERAEDEAKEQLGHAMAERDRQAARLSAAADQLAAAKAAKAGTAGAGFDINAMLAHQAFVERGEREQQAAELELSRRDAEVAARRVALQDAAQERQVLDKLRDKQELAHRRESERLEAAHVDELALAMHRRRSVAR